MFGEGGFFGVDGARVRDWRRGLWRLEVDDDEEEEVDEEEVEEVDEEEVEE